MFLSSREVFNRGDYVESKECYSFIFGCRGIAGDVVEGVDKHGLVKILTTEGIVFLHHGTLVKKEKQARLI